MELRFKVSARINKPVEDVFEAIADPKKLSGYFTTGGASARLEAGANVMWDFADFPGAFPVEVVEVVKDRRIVLRWASSEQPSDAADTVAKTTVTMTFEAIEPGRTLVEIGEEGWTFDQAGLGASYGNCQGWSQMLCALKAYVEHGINLREGMYK